MATASQRRPRQAQEGLEQTGDPGHLSPVQLSGLGSGQFQFYSHGEGGGRRLYQPISVGLLLHVARLLQKPQPLCLAHCQSERHLLEDTAHGHL